MTIGDFFVRYMATPMGYTHASLSTNPKAASKGAKNVDKQLIVQTSGVARTGELSEEITPLMVSEAISAASGGDIGKLQGLYMRMAASDAKFRGLVTALHAGVLANPLRVFPSKSKTPQSKEYAQVANDMLTMFRHSDLLRKLTRSYLSGVSIYEPLWTMTKGRDGKDRILPYRLELVPPTLYRMNTEEDSDLYGQLMIATEDEPEGVPVSDFPWGRLLITTDGAEVGFYDQAGASRPCLFWFLVKNKNAQWWAEFNELYGEPSRIGYYEEGTSEEDLASLKSFIQQVGRAAWALLPAGTEIDIAERVSAGQVKVYEDIIELANTEMAIAIVGQTQTSDGGQYGSFAKANVHMVVLYQIIKMIGLMIKEAFDDLLVATLVYNFGPDIDYNDLPEVKLVVPNPEEKEVKARVFKYAQELGLELPAMHVRDELGIPEPDDDDEILEPAHLQKAGADPNADPNADAKSVSELSRDYKKEDAGRKTQDHGSK